MCKKRDFVTPRRFFEDFSHCVMSDWLSRFQFETKYTDKRPPPPSSHTFPYNHPPWYHLKRRKFCTCWEFTQRRFRIFRQNKLFDSKNSKTCIPTLNFTFSFSTQKSHFSTSELWTGFRAKLLKFSIFGSKVSKHWNFRLETSNYYLSSKIIKIWTFCHKTLKFRIKKVKFEVKSTSSLVIRSIRRGN